MFTIDVPQIEGEGQFLAFKMTIFGDPDNQYGVQPHMKDFFLEGFAVNDTSDCVRVEPKKCVIF